MPAAPCTAPQSPKLLLDKNAIDLLLYLPSPACSYVFLVDSQGRLRWRGSGTPTDQELQSLLRCTEELLQQQEQG